MNFKLLLKMKMHRQTPKMVIFWTDLLDLFQLPLLQGSAKRYHVLTRKEHIPQYLKACNKTALLFGLFVLHHFITLQMPKSLRAAVPGVLSLSYNMPWPDCTSLLHYCITEALGCSSHICNTTTELLRWWKVEKGFIPQAKGNGFCWITISAHVSGRFFPRRAWESLSV